MYAKLQSLKIHCLVEKFPAGLFLHQSSIHNISLHTRRLTAETIPELCLMKQLKVVDLSSNDIMGEPGSLHCLASLEHLSSVDLSSNPISEPITPALQPLQNVSNYISLQQCGISSLQNDTFYGFKVKTLDLSFNNIFYIHQMTFAHLVQLTELDLTGNEELSMPFNWIQNLDTLQMLYLGHSGLTDFPFITANVRKLKLLGKYNVLMPRSFSDLESLEELDMSFCSIRYIERHAFHNLPRLEILDLKCNVLGSNGSNLSNFLLDVAHCPLKILDLSSNPLYNLNETFKPLRQNNISKLVLRSCKIEKIFPGTFANFQNLHELYLSSNKIRKLSENTFQGLTNIQELDLSQNNIEELSPRTFQSLKSKRQLNLSRNSIKELSRSTFQSLTQIERLDLSQNLIQEFSPRAFEGLTHLTHLSLHHNELNQLVGNIIGLNSPLTYLNLRNNYLREIYLFSTSTFMKIDLSHNKLFIDFSANKLTGANCPTLSYFSNMRKYYFGQLLCLQKIGILEELNLSGNQIGRLHSKPLKDIWVNATQLVRLYINRCQIKSLAPRIFGSLIHLEVLDLSSNKLPSVHPYVFKGLSSLTELYLHDNVITNVNFESFVYLPHLSLLSLADNPLVCTCNILWISQAVATLNTVYIPNQNNLVCNTPRNVENVVVNKLKRKVSDCEIKWTVILKPIAIGIGCMLSLIGGYVVWRFRWHIRYTLFLAKAGRGRFEEMHDDTEYVYDAFVAYSSEDLPWVKRQLLPNVDEHYIGPGGFKLCLHHRDWLVGVDITENIVKSIAESRRTILVLSKDFAASYWCRIELAMAHFRLDAEGRKKA